MILPGKILFPLGSSVIQESAYPILDKIINELKKIPYPISIEGNSDDLPNPNSESKTNWALSIKRAVNITEYFQEKGISPDRLKAVGHSIYDPTQNLVGDVDRNKNRRVEIVVLFKSIEDKLDYGKKNRGDKIRQFEVDADFR